MKNFYGSARIWFGPLPIRQTLTRSVGCSILLTGTKKSLGRRRSFPPYHQQQRKRPPTEAALPFECAKLALQIGNFFANIFVGRTVRELRGQRLIPRQPPLKLLLFAFACHS